MSLKDQFDASEVLSAPVKGEAIPISQVSDPTFGREILGRGIAIIPANGKVFAPCDATVDMVFDTGHAVSLMSPNGAEILIHIGLDTVNLNGRHFVLHCAFGDEVKRGQLLIDFDREAVAAAGYDTVIPVVVCNSGEFSLFRTYLGKTVEVGETVIELGK